MNQTAILILAGAAIIAILVLVLGVMRRLLDDDSPEH